jgi:hypothetical protein
MAELPLEEHSSSSAFLFDVKGMSKVLIKHNRNRSRFEYRRG